MQPRLFHLAGFAVSNRDLRNAPKGRNVQNAARREDGQLTPHVAEPRPDIQARLLKVDHGEAIIQVMDWVGVQAIECLIRRDQQHSLAPSHLYTDVASASKLRCLLL